MAGFGLGAGSRALIGVGRRVCGGAGAGAGAGRTNPMRAYCQKALASEEPTLSLRAFSVHSFVIGFFATSFVYAVWFRITANRMWKEVMAKKY